MACVCAFKTSSSIDTASGLVNTLPKHCSARGCTGIFNSPPNKRQCSTYVPAPANSDYAQFFKIVPMVEGIDLTVSCIDRSAPRMQQQISSATLAAAREKVRGILENMHAGEPAVAFATCND